jgi:site-specific DNA recombinase
MPDRLAKLVTLSCLAPDIITAILEGRQPEHLPASRLMGTALSPAWNEQRQELGFS